MDQSWLACPNCLTLAAPAECCKKCSQPLAWIQRLGGELEASLTEGENPGWTPELRLYVGDGEAKIPVLRSEPGPFDLALGAEANAKCRWDGPAHTLSVEWTGQTKRCPLPGTLQLDGFRIQASLYATRAPHEEPLPIQIFGAAIVPDMQPKTTGALAGNDISLRGPGIAGKHFLIVRGPTTTGPDNGFWIIDLGGQSGTFVNRGQVLCRRLEADDLVQAGGYAWTFAQSQRMLVPVDQIDGAELELKELAVGRRLGPVSLTIKKGEFVAVVGESGSGKSTLVKAILGTPGCRGHGVVYAEGRDTRGDLAWFRSITGYLSQDSAVHPDLLGRQVLDFSARLRGKPAADDAISQTLRQVDLRPDTAFPNELSGGQRKRLQTAAELIVEPGVFLLDEPASGLDPRRERDLLKLLRNLSHRGCTVVVVTHGLKRLDMFDRVLYIVKGRIEFDGSPEQLRARIPSGDFDDLGSACFEDGTPADPPKRRRQRGSRAARRPASWLKESSRQFLLLLGRDLARLRNRASRRLLPLMLIPLAFAVSVALAAPPNAPAILGFLTLMSVIWLSASGSLLTIADEREIVDHERLLFLGVSPYIASKAIFFGVLSAVQTAWFFLPLILLRSLSGRPQDTFYEPAWVLLHLILVGWAATGLGLGISAAVGRNRQLAAAILPFVMMVQIVFHAQVRGEGDLFSDAYRHLHFRQCEGFVESEEPNAASERCRRYAHAFVQHRVKGEAKIDRIQYDQPRWLCGLCDPKWEDFLVEQATKKSDKLTEHASSPKPDETASLDSPPSQAGLSDDHSSLSRVERNNSIIVSGPPPTMVARPVLENEQQQARGRPFSLTVLATYLTISRYGDIALRTYAYQGVSDDSFAREKIERYDVWRREAVAVLAIMAIGLPFVAGIFLRLSEWGCWPAGPWSVRHAVQRTEDTGEAQQAPQVREHSIRSM